jgi:hypothetical protein
MIDAMKQALEALKRPDEIDGMYSWVDTEQALRQAIEQAEQWNTSDMAHRSGGMTIDVTDLVNQVIKEEREAVKRPWVGLTDEEIKDILDCGRGGLVDIRKAEQRLKERNT